MTSGTNQSDEIDTTDQAWGSDYIADLLKAMDIPFVAFNPGASFRGIEESIVNYNDNSPEVIEAPHECLSVAIAHGYAKATNKPAVCILHNVVGTMHGAMGIYNAWCDRVPVLALSGTGPMRKSKRRPFYDWVHSALVQGDLVRGYTKWDDQPWHIDGAAESLLRATKIADTKPKGPVYVTIDHELQECELDGPMAIPDISKFGTPSKMAPDPTAINEAASILVNAEFPVIVTDQVGDSRTAVDALVDLAETLGAPVLNGHRMGGAHRYNFPNTHPLELSDTNVIERADVILALDVWALDYQTTKMDSVTRERTDLAADATLIDIGTHELRSSGLIPDQFPMQETDVGILADTELAIPALTDAVEERLDSNSRERIAERTDEIASLHAARQAEWDAEVEEEWDDVPISLPRLAYELWEIIQDDDWVLVNGSLRGQAYKRWEVDEFDKSIGTYSGGGGIGYGIGAAIGGALAYRDTDRIPINLQPDGDLMYYPGGLWTIAHYDLPIFTVVHNNGSLFNSTNHRMVLANYRGRDDSFERARIGTGIWEPTPDYASMAESMGVSGYGPIEDPDDIADIATDAWEEVKAGNPVLVDVICKPR